MSINIAFGIPTLILLVALCFFIGRLWEINHPWCRDARPPVEDRWRRAEGDRP